MPAYNFKTMQVVPPAKDFIDIVLSKTQRQTPTVVHNGWSIQRIRQFYMRKVKFTAQNWNEKLTQILEDFPKVEDIHPFYSDLLNVLYDKDHYKLALGQLNTAKNIIDKLAQDYVRLLKYGDSLYRCKELKRAALGRMCSLMKGQDSSLKYLEQVRQHMSRLPGIDPNTRSLLLCGYPNVGKSSMMNILTRADVEVQPYAFTTKSLYVGHMDYRYMRWQVLDTPGILDRPLEERNTIEMQSITALAHLRCAVLYLVDISEQCGYSLTQQAALFHSIKPLFANKPLLIVVNKTDVRPLDSLTAEEQKLVQDMEAEARRISSGGTSSSSSSSSDISQPSLMTSSTLTEDGVMAVKQTACDRLLNFRVEMKVSGKRITDVLNRMHVAVPKTRGGQSRPPVIPPSVLAAREAAAAAAAKQQQQQRKTEKDLQEEHGGAGVYSADLRKHYDLKDPSWRHDIMPEVLDGHNIADFIDPDIDAKLAELERQEELEEAQHAQELPGVMDTDELTDAQAAELAAIRSRKKQIITAHRLKKSSGNNRPVMPAKHKAKRTEGLRAALGALGIDTAAAEQRMRERSQSRGRKRSRSAGPADGDTDMLDADPTPKKRIHSSKSRGMSRGRSASIAPPAANTGLRDAVMSNKAVKLADKAQWKINKMAKVGEADRVIPTKMPKHLFSGKRPKGKTDRR